MALDTLAPGGEFQVRLNVWGKKWAQLAYQFAHEFGHVLADSRTFPLPHDRCSWIEEALCSAASIVALKEMAAKWAVTPPYPNWAAYAPELRTYLDNHLSEADHCLPEGVSFAEWLRGKRPLLEAEGETRTDITPIAGELVVIAKELVPILESDTTAWKAIRRLHDQTRTADTTPEEHLAAWQASCPKSQRAVVERLTTVFLAS
jgi:hypothetical protein